jgi:tRNA(Ile)-lysidine synthase
MPKNSQKSLLIQVQKNIEQNKLIAPGDFVYIALSGGADSKCLFDILFKLQEKLKFKLAACHFNHKMRGEDSNRDQKFVQEICIERGVELKIGRHTGKSALKSELEARKVRYAYFEKILASGGGVKMALAHNANDYAETFLMRLIRGTGLKGMRSIPLQRKKFFRPLLPFTRKQILSYLEAEKLSFVTDSSNQNTKYFRNNIRHNLLPQIVQLNPNFMTNLSANIQILSEDFDYIYSMAEKKYKKLIKLSSNQLSFDRKEWLLLHPALRFEVLRMAMASLGVEEDISSLHLTNIYSMIEKGIGKKSLPLPHSLLCSLISGKIILSKKPHSRR